MTVAAIDIGTNTLLMTIGRREQNHSITILHDAHNIARLGEGVDENKMIQPQALARAVAILEEYRALCKEYHVDHIVAVTTSAVRDAANRSAVLEAMSSAVGAPILMISGEDEARYSFLGGAETDACVTVMDIGGGSTEFITGEHGDILFRKSLDMGAVRLTERFFTSLPPQPHEIEYAREFIQSLLRVVPSEKLSTLIGVGGTFTSLAAIHLHISEFTPSAIHWQTIPAFAIHRRTDELLSMTTEQLRSHPCIHPKRADILPAGALILSETLKRFSYTECTVSTKGLRYGLLWETIKNSLTHSARQS
jgi:exopolyphosphatase / guanosine-5'-triphosphate,3'-diphosphate pyrophosphatase